MAGFRMKTPGQRAVGGSQAIDEAIARAEAEGDFHYYRCWLEAFQDLVEAKGICGPGALDRRVAELSARPPGHDHG